MWCPPIPQVRVVEERYRDEIDSLRRENTELRRRVIHKSEQFNSYRSQVERSQGKVRGRGRGREGETVCVCVCVCVSSPSCG